MMPRVPLLAMLQAYSEAQSTCPLGQDRRAFRYQAMYDAAPDQTTTSLVQVKRLVWDDYGPAGARAITKSGDYLIQQDIAGEWSAWNENVDGFEAAEYTKSSVIAACQSDYEQRILSGIVL
ncbi:MAG: hypothetical protein JKY52_08330 [Flavobacteriales bacterium]|nr:hypothetical protein [Flavobacteriales bacterium]